MNNNKNKSQEGKLSPANDQLGENKTQHFADSDLSGKDAQHKSGKNKCH